MYEINENIHGVTTQIFNTIYQIWRIYYIQIKEYYKALFVCNHNFYAKCKLSYARYRKTFRLKWRIQNWIWMNLESNRQVFPHGCHNWKIASSFSEKAAQNLEMISPLSKIYAKWWSHQILPIFFRGQTWRTFRFHIRYINYRDARKQKIFQSKQSLILWGMLRKLRKYWRPSREVYLTLYEH